MFHYARPKIPHHTMGRIRELCVSLLRGKKMKCLPIHQKHHVFRIGSLALDTTVSTVRVTGFRSIPRSSADMERIGALGDQITMEHC